MNAIDLPVSPIVSRSGPLRVKRTINGGLRLQGVFRMQDQEGFPVDMSYEMAKEKGIEIDWVEALVDAGRQCIFKYDQLLAQIRLLIPAAQAEAAERMFSIAFMEFKPPVDDGTYFFPRVCEQIYQRMWVADCPDLTPP